jgi:hypothetical protein
MENWMVSKLHTVLRRKEPQNPRGGRSQQAMVMQGLQGLLAIVFHLVYGENPFSKKESHPSFLFFFFLSYPPPI